MSAPFRLEPLPPSEIIHDEHQDGSPRFIRHEYMDWRGVRIRVEHEADYLSGFLSHISLHVVAPFGAPLPVTGTGYRSHFVDPDVVESFGGPVAFVSAWLDEEATSEEWRELQAASLQMSLF